MMDNQPYLTQLKALNIEAKKLVAKNKVEEAITLLLNSPLVKTRQNDLIGFQTRWTKNEYDHQVKGILENPVYNLEHRKIIDGLTTLADMILQDAKNPPAPIIPPSAGAPIIPNAALPLTMLVYDIEDMAESVKFKKFISGMLKRNKRIKLFDIHTDVLGGDDVETKRNAELEKAALVLCIISFNFLDSDAYELAQKAQAKGIPVIPLLVSEVSLEDSIFQGIYGLPKNQKFISQWPNVQNWTTEDAAYTTLSMELRSFVNRKFPTAS